MACGGELSAKKPEPEKVVRYEPKGNL